MGEYTNINFNLDQSCKVGVEVYDMFGKKVYSVREREYASGQNMIRVNSNELANGMYLLRLAVGNQVVTRKISVIK